MGALRALATFGASASLVMAVAGPAAAAPPDPRGQHVEFERFQDVGTEILSGEELGCPQIVDEVTVSFDVTGLHKGTPQGKDGLVHFLDNVHGTETFSANGHTFTHEFNSVFRDLTVVDEGDTLLVTALGAGFDRYFLDGERLFLDTGTNRVQFRVGEDDTSFVGVVKPSTGTNDTQGRDFCTDLAQFLELDVVADEGS